jgi:uncharacterized protein YwgA
MTYINSIGLSGIIKRIYPNFDLSTFNNRLKLQKVIYLLQASGINLGYKFNLYHFGPYSPQLTKTAYCIEDFSKAKEVGFEDDVIEKKFKQFIEHISKVKDNVKWLELSSTIHLFKQIYPSDLMSEITRKVISKKQCTSKDVENVWSEVREWLN